MVSPIIIALCVCSGIAIVGIVAVCYVGMCKFNKPRLQTSEFSFDDIYNLEEQR